MIKKFYLFFYYILLVCATLSLLLFFAATRPQAPEYFAEYLLKPLDVGYSRVEGSLMEGFVIYDLRYGEGVRVKKLQLRYKLARLMRRVPHFDLLALQNPVITPQKLDGQSEEGGFFMPPFALTLLKIEKMEILVQEPLKLTLDAHDLRHDGAWTIARLNAQASLGAENPSTAAVHARSLRYHRQLSIERFDATGRMRFEEADINVTQLSAQGFQYDKALSVSRLDAVGLIRFEEGELSVSALKIKGLRYDDATSAQSVEAAANAIMPKYGLFVIGLNGQKLRYDTALSLQKLDLEAQTPYGRVTANGSMVSNRVLSKATLSPDTLLIEKYLGFLQGVPGLLKFDINATTKEITVASKFAHLGLKADENLSVRDADVQLAYRTGEDTLAFETRYALGYGKYGAQVSQKGVLAFSGAYTTKLEASKLIHPVNLPFSTLWADISGDAEKLVADVTAGPFRFDITRSGYNRFAIGAKGEQIALSFLENIPDIARDNVLSGEANATLELSPFSVHGSLFTRGRHMSTQGGFSFKEGRALYSGTLRPKPESELFGALPMKKFSPNIKITMQSYRDTRMLYIDADPLKATLFKSGPAVNGWGELGTSRFDVVGRVEDNGEADLVLNASTDSLYTVLSQLGLADFEGIEFFDAAVEVEAALTLTDTLRVKGRIGIPWYALRPDAQSSYAGKDNFIEAVLEGHRLNIGRYRFDVMDRAVYCDKPSVLTVDTNGTVHFEAMHLYDDLTLQGHLKLPELKGALLLKSERFTYAGKEGNVTAKADISIVLDGLLSQTVEGEITLIEGIIKYAPPGEYAIEDEDILVVQEIRAPSKAKRFVNIKIGSQKPLLYSIEGVSVRFTPDFVIWQESGRYLQLLGTIFIEGGEAKAGEKEFEVANGEIYLHGARPVNPYLNLLLHYSIEGKEIKINIANTLKSPVFVFGSSPAMSQNDIISYLMFGAPSATVFENSQESSGVVSLGSGLLGTGLKSMFKEATGIKLDTLNILTTKEGGLGYEVGTRLGKKLRLLYKSETTSSVVLQYRLNEWIRVDVDVYETGQGVSLLYIKDFSDPLTKGEPQ